MSIDWDAEVLGPVMAVFGANEASQLPTYTPAGGTSFPLADSVFDRAYLLVTLDGDGSENTTRRPVLGVRDALFTVPPAQNDLVFIPSVGITYIVKEVRSDGHGWTLLALNAVRT